MPPPSVRWLAHLVLFGVLAAACAGAMPEREEVSGDAEAVPLEKAPTVQAPGDVGPPIPDRLAQEGLLQPEAGRLPDDASASAYAVPLPLPLAVPWVQSVRSTELLGGPYEDAERFAMLPERRYLKVLEQRPDWALVVYGGDGEGRQPGTAWVRVADLGPPTEAPGWVRNYRPTTLWSGPDGMGARYTTLPEWSWLELMGTETGGRLPVRYAGDGRGRLPGYAWVDARDVGPVLQPTRMDVPPGYPAIAEPGVLRLPVPYRSQLDGTPWEAANCGPVVLGMALESLGINVSSASLRQDVQDAQRLWGDEAGSFIWALAQVGERHGARALDLNESDGKFRRWSVEDVRGHLRDGRPVIVQVRFRSLPDRHDSSYYGDHYIVLTGMVGESFLYHDPIDSDGVGFDRLMTAAELTRAMDANHRAYAYTGFALTHR